MKTVVLSILLIAGSIQPLNGLILSKDVVLEYLRNHKTLLTRSAIVGGIGFALYQTFKTVIQTEEKQIAAFNDDIVIKQITSKYLPTAQTTFKMYKQDRYIGLIVSLNLGSQSILGNLTVSKNVRGMGYGTLLLNTAVNRLKEDGFTEIFLDADPCETDAAGILASLPAGQERDDRLQKLIHFYQKNGFEGIDKEVAKKKVPYFNAIDLSYPMQYKHV